ncbi:uncharacterized protein LAJ45_05037 [Morchella importuna]|uniref:uncharacterized protein n=1 Tax=Morchella importuna TaxID=1174673 RepID=UPI001E8E7528|nr:uncharacterized protein LAJ45_05037 [Morchella importuna]KAH8150856.1 hypothetical protein LAJ45_05037 [Morchella importuna]
MRFTRPPAVRVLKIPPWDLTGVRIAATDMTFRRFWSWRGKCRGRSIEEERQKKKSNNGVGAIDDEERWVEEEEKYDEDEKGGEGCDDVWGERCFGENDVGEWRKKKREKTRQGK